MNGRKDRQPWVTAVAMLLATVAVADTTVDWWTIDTGGGTCTGGAFELSGTIGQPDAGPVLSGGSFELTGGFWVAASATPPICRGDSNCNGFVDWRDIDFFVAAQNDNESAWHALHMTVYGTPPTCPFANNDVNGNGFVNWRDIDPFVALQNTTCP